MRYLAVILLTVISVGCMSADKKGDSGGLVYELPAKYEPLEGIKQRPRVVNAFNKSDTVITTIGSYCYVKDLQKWLNRKPPGSIRFHATMLHEQVHSRRQKAKGTYLWVARYSYDREFMWREEQLGWYEELRVARLNPQSVAVILSNYKNLAGKMVSFDEALKWVNDVYAGRWSPPAE